MRWMVKKLRLFTQIENQDYGQARAKSANEIPAQTQDTLLEIPQSL